MDNAKTLAEKLQVISLEKNFNTEKIISINELFDDLIKREPYNIDVLAIYNEFRVSHASLLPKTRPRIFIGGMSHNSLISMHTVSLLQIADVISLTTSKADIHRKDRIVYDASNDSFYDIIKKIPHGFLPDFFWDNQAEGHAIPFDIMEAPFPIIASVCHMYEINTMRSICNIFDAIIPLSKSFIPVLQNITSKPIIDLPFGLNWAAFVHIPFQGWDKDREVDVSVTFGDGINPVYHDFRSRIRELAYTFQQKYRDKYHVVIANSLDKEQYYQLLGQSKISINVVGIHGPYNYRTNEVIQSGAMLFQLDNRYYPFDSQIENYFENNKHLVVFDFNNFEEKLVYFLEHPKERLKIAKQGKEFLEKYYSYHALYKRLFSVAKHIDITDNGENKRVVTQHGNIHISSSYLYPVTQKKDELFVIRSLKEIEQLPSEERNNNLIVSLGVVFKKTQDLKVILDLLKPYPELFRAFQSGFSSGIEYLYNKSPQHLLVAWHYFFIAIDCGCKPSISADELINKIMSEKNFSFDIDLFFFYYNIHLSYLDNNEYNYITIHEFQVSLLKFYNDNHKEKIFETYKKFMLFHCIRYLLELGISEKEIVDRFAVTHKNEIFGDQTSILAKKILPESSKTLRALTLVSYL